MEDDSLVHMRRLQQVSEAVAEYRGAELMEHLDQMLTTLADVYKAQLADVSVEELVRVQSHLKQTLALRGVLRGTQALPLV